MNRLTVTNIEAKGNLLRVHFRCSGRIRRFFNENSFFAEYDTNIEDVPEVFLVIPFLATVCPVVWACGAEVYVSAVDEEFLGALKAIKKTFRKFYPEVGFSGSIHVGKVVKLDVGVQPKSMMLFSGGVDSIFTYLRHRDEKPDLVVVNGADVRLDNREAWKVVLDVSNDFSEKTGSKLRTIQTNFRDMVDEYMLGSIYGKKLHTYWYGGVMHGMALLGFCAPLTYVDKIGKLYLSSTYTKKFSEPWGSHPDIDNNVKWAGTTASHDGYELSRQEKLFVIADYIKKTDQKFFIRSCWYTEKIANCSVCEKCSRTILGLELAGMDPNEYGFEVNGDTFTAMKKSIEDCKLYERLGDMFLWKDIQHYAGSEKDFPNSEVKDLLNWLMTVDIDAFRQEPEAESFFQNYRWVYQLFLPYPIYKISRTIYKKIHFPLLRIMRRG